MTDLTPEQIQAIQAKFATMKLYDEKKKIADQKNNTLLNDLVNLINSVFRTHGITDRIDNSHIRFNAEYIGNITRIDDKKFSEILFNSIYPEPNLKLYSHYTSFGGGCSILENKELRLYNLLKNFGAEEFRLFYENHGITGYQDTGETLGVKTDYRSLMSEIFSLCLTSETNATPTLWNHFAVGGTGIKLTFEVTSKIPDFREVYYSNPASPERVPLLGDLADAVTNKYGYPLNYAQISKIGAFYIHGDYSNEKEYRFLVKRTSDNYNAYSYVPVIDKDDISYIVLPFFSTMAEFKLKKVTRGPNCLMNEFDTVVSIVNKNYTDPITIER